MGDKTTKILAGIFSALVAIFVMLLGVLNNAQDKLEILLQKKVNKEFSDSEHLHLKDLINNESEGRKEGDKSLNNRVDRIEDREELRNIK